MEFLKDGSGKGARVAIFAAYARKAHTELAQWLCMQRLFAPRVAAVRGRLDHRTGRAA